MTVHPERIFHETSLSQQLICFDAEHVTREKRIIDKRISYNPGFRNNTPNM